MQELRRSGTEVELHHNLSGLETQTKSCTPVGGPGRQAQLQRGLNRRQGGRAAVVVGLAPEPRPGDALDGRLPVAGRPLRAERAQEPLQPLVDRLPRLGVPVAVRAA